MRSSRSARRTGEAAEPGRTARFRHGALAAAALLCGGCAMVTARGVVRNADGVGVENATVRIATVSSPDKPLTVEHTTPNGCFDYSDIAPRHQKQFTLEVSAPGYKTVRLNFGTYSELLLVILSPETSDNPSEYHRMDFDQKRGIFEPLCVTFIQPGASSLGPT